MPIDNSQRDFAYRHCENLVREQDPDRYFSLLFAPSEKRPHLFALYAFSAEIAHIHEGIREPLTGEIRLQWWRDALGELAQSVSGEEQPVAAANPVILALADTVRKFDLPLSPLLNLIDARVFDLYEEPMPSLNELDGYCGETCSVLFMLAARILAGAEVNIADAAGHAGVAYALCGLLRAFPWHARARKVYVPEELLVRHGLTPDDVIHGEREDSAKVALLELRGIAAGHLEKARQLLPSVPIQVRSAFIPLALVEPYLKLMNKQGYQPFRTILDLPQWRKQWILWRAARKF